MPDLRLRGGERGEEAIQSLGARLPEVAAHYRKSEAELRAVLRRDRSLRLDPRGRLNYLCEGLVAPVVTGQTNLDAGPAAALFPLSQTFLLHSKPGSNRKIFLDFDGHTMSGNAWTAGYNGGTNIIAPPWDTDGNPGSFSASEQTAIQQIWFRVAEDFAPFDVDVTTEFPGEAALTRSNSGDQLYGTRALVSPLSSYFGNYGGIAYVGVFDSIGDYNKPALIFPEKLGNDEKNIAEAISHEVGHNLGLSHDGTTTGSEYYTGQGNWAPIMGVGYSKPIVQWSRGEYANANNTENDYTVIGQNGLVYRADDYGNTIGTATALANVFNITNTGYLERTNDVDFFSFQTGGGTATFTVTPWERGANVHFLLALYNSGGTLITNREVADTGSGVQVVKFSAILSAGTYYVSVDGIGSGNPSTTGYSDYGSLGNYTLTVNLPPTSQWLPTLAGNFSWSNPANWLDGAVPNTVDTTASINNNIVGEQLITLDAPITIGRLVLGDTNATHGFVITNGAGGSLAFDVSVGSAAILKTRGTNDLIAAGLILQDDLVVSNGTPAQLTLAGAISGSRSVTKTGAGVVVLAGTNSYTGDTVISAGALVLDAAAVLTGTTFFDVRSNAVLDAAALAGGLTLNSGRRLAGSGGVAGDVTFNAGSTLYPGPTNAAGTLTFSNHLTLAGGVTWRLDLAANNSVGDDANDLVRVAGDLSLAGTNPIQVNLLEGQLLSPGTYTILTYGGTLIGGASNLSASGVSRQVFAMDDSVPGEIHLQVSANPANLVWRGDGTLNRWDTNTFNWRNAGVSDKFYPLDAVLFDDSGSNNNFINLLTPVPPASVTVSAAKNYTFGGAGRISGATSLTKLGAGTLTISNANDFDGLVTVSAGVLKTANATALGTVLGATFVNNAGALDLNGVNLGAEPVVVSGAGAGSGAIFNSGASQPNALRFIALAGDTTFGGSGRWDVRANPSASFAGNNFKLTKTNANEVWLVDLGNTGLGDIEVRQGLLGIQGATTLGAPAGNLSVWSGATLRLSGTDLNILHKALHLTNASVTMSVGSNAFAGPVDLNLTNTFGIDSQFEISGPVQGDGSLLKSGTGTLLLSGSNSFTGAVLLDTASTSASAGAVRLVSSHALQTAASPLLIRNNNSGSSTLQLDSGIVVTQAVQMAARNVAVPTLQNLGGSNTLTGDVILQTGGANYWFQSDAGTLHLAGGLPVSTPGGVRALTFLGAGNLVISGLLTNGAGGGTINVIKSGPGTLTLEHPNSYTGGTTLNAGVIRVNADRALGTGDVTANPGTNTARMLLGAEIVVTNRIVANSVNPGAASGFLSCADEAGATLAGPILVNANATTGGHFAGPTRGLSGGAGGSGGSGGGDGSLRVSGAITAPGTNFIVVRLGNVRFSGGGDYAEIQTRAGTTSLGATDGLATNAVLDLGGNGNPQAPTVFDLNGFDQTLAGLKNVVGPNNIAWVTNSAPTTNALTLDLGAGEHSFGGSIVGPLALTLNSGTQTLAKTGAAPGNGLYLFTGATVINGGTLVLATGIMLSNTPVIELGAAGTLDVSASGLVLGPTQLILGNGTILGNVTAAGSVHPGLSIGILTCSNDVVLEATSQTLLEIRAAPLTNDLLRVSGTLTYGGHLVVTNLAGTLAAGDTFKLFDAPTHVGAFLTNDLPPLGIGLAWEFSPSNGTLSVISTVATNPTNIAVMVTGNVLELSWPADHLGWRLEAQTNALAVGIESNWFEVTGSGATNLIFMPLDVLNESVFFRLVYP